MNVHPLHLPDQTRDEHRIELRLHRAVRAVGIVALRVLQAVRLGVHVRDPVFQVRAGRVLQWKRLQDIWRGGGGHRGVAGESADLAEGGGQRLKLAGIGERDRVSRRRDIRAHQPMRRAE